MTARISTIPRIILGGLVMFALMFGLSVGAMSQVANATETSVDLSDIKVSNASFAAASSIKVTTKTVLSGGVNLVLNVSPGPMPKSQTKKCWTAKPGKTIQNEVIKNGKHVAIKWKIPKGDNVFCTKKGGGKQVYKKSCGNRVWGVPGHKSPKRHIPLVKGKFKIVDYLTWTATQDINVAKKASATASVESEDKTCKAVASIEVLARIRVAVRVVFQSRLQAEATASGRGRITQKVKTSTTVKGQINTAVDVALKGKARAMCTNAPPPPPPPSPPVITAKTVVNDVDINDTTRFDVSYSIPQGHQGTVSADALQGSTVLEGPQKVTGSGTIRFTLRAKSEVGTDQVQVIVVDDVTGASSGPVLSNEFVIGTHPAPHNASN